MVAGDLDQDLFIDDSLLNNLKRKVSNLHNMAFALLLPNEIADLLLRADSPLACLSQLLTLWISNKLPNATLPTYGNLEKDKFQQFLKNALLNFTADTNAADIPEQELYVKIAATSSKTLCIAEGCSVIMGVQVVKPAEYYHVKLLWYFEGDLLKCTPHIHIMNANSGLRVYSFLCVQAKNLLREGKYSCSFEHTRANDKICSIALSVITPIDKHNNVLTTFYNEKPEVPRDTWPPESCKSYINLALINQESTIKKGEFWRSTIRGDVDDILNDKESVIYKAAFNEIDSGTRLLVEGRPGSGKTTLMHKVSRAWASGELKFLHNRLLFLVHLRAFCSDPNISLEDIISCYYSGCVVKEISEYASNNNGLGLCFILDGLDEYLPGKSNNFIFRLIGKQVLPKATVIVASRPAAAMPFRKEATKQIEVIGFLVEQIYDYVSRYPFSDDYKLSQLRQYFDQHPNVLHTCYLPVHSAMVCFLFDELQESMPQTETEIYKEFTKYTILRFLYRQDSELDECINSINDLSTTHNDHYRKICRLAYEMTAAIKQVMEHVEIKSFFDLKEEGDSFGLVTIDRVATRLGFQRMYTFLHLTFQEFLAADHISRLEEAEQLELITKHRNDLHMQQVWKFYCGLANFDHRMKTFEVLIGNSQFGSLYKIQCCFETQQPNLCDVAVENNSLSFSDSFLSASNFIAMAYVLNNVKKNPVTELSFTSCTFGKGEFNILVNKAGSKLGNLTTLCCKGYDTEQLGVLKHMLHSCTSLRVLDISDTPMGEAEMNMILDKDLRLPNLEVCIVGYPGCEIYSSMTLQASVVSHFMALSQGNFFNVLFSGIGKISLPSDWPLLTYFQCNPPHLLLNFNQLSLSAAESLKQELLTSKRYIRISLVHCGIDDTLASCLSWGFEKCTDLEMLELSFNNIGDSGARDIVRSVKHCKHLHTLDISFNKIASADIFKEMENLKIITNALSLSDTDLEDFNATDIASMLESSPRQEEVTQFSISNNRISVNGLRSLNNQMIKCQNLLEIDLSSNLLGADGATVLANILKHLPKLNLLDVSSNYLCNDGARAIAQGLQNCPFLLELKISSNHIGSDGAKALAKSLTSCMILQMLKIDSNSLKSEGAKAISSALKYWSSFSLDIRSNFIGKNGANALAEAASSLRELFIADNSIGNDGLEYLITTFKKSGKTLRALDISSNGITSDCPSLHMLPDILNDVTVLSIGQNKVDIQSSINLATMISNSSTHLLKLDISNTHISGSHREALAHSLRHCTHLQELNVTNNAVTTTIYAFAESLESLTEIQALYMGHNTIGSDGAKLVVSSLCHCPDLRTLHINNNHICTKGVMVILSSLKSFPRLSELNISHNDCDTLNESHILGVRKLDISGVSIHLKKSIHIQDLTCDEPSESYIKCCSSLQRLKLRRRFKATLSKTLKYCRKLRKLYITPSPRNALDVQRNHMNALDVSDLIYILSKYCRSLSVLDLSNNNLEIRGFNMLTNSFFKLKNCTYLQSLNISGNISANQEPNAVVVTSPVSFKDWQWLRTLDISHNCLGENDFCAFMKGLPESLMHLYVSQCNLTAQHMNVLASMLKCHPALLTLDVSGNHFGDKGTLALAGGLKSSLALQVLFVYNNGIAEKCVRVLVDVLQNCKDLVSLDISGNPISLECMESLERTLSDCRVTCIQSSTGTGSERPDWHANIVEEHEQLSETATSAPSTLPSEPSPAPLSPSVLTPPPPLTPLSPPLVPPTVPPSPPPPPLGWRPTPFFPIVSPRPPPPPPSLPPRPRPPLTSPVLPPSPGPHPSSTSPALPPGPDPSPTAPSPAPGPHPPLTSPIEPRSTFLQSLKQEFKKHVIRMHCNVVVAVVVVLCAMLAFYVSLYMS